MRGSKWIFSTEPHIRLVGLGGIDILCCFLYIALAHSELSGFTFELGLGFLASNANWVSPNVDSFYPKSANSMTQVQKYNETIWIKFQANFLFKYSFLSFFFHGHLDKSSLMSSHIPVFLSSCFIWNCKSIKKTLIIME